MYLNQKSSEMPNKLGSSVGQKVRRICLMSGAVINAGDYLIENRTLALIKHFLPNSDVTILNRVSEDYSGQISKLNEFDAIIFSGGPLFQPGLYRKKIPFVSPDKINEISKPVFFVGGGLHANCYSCAYTENDKLFYDKGVHGAESIGCRDVFTLKFLRHEGYPAVLTGCPAWYDLNYLGNNKLRINKIEDIGRICVSDPADKFNVPMLLDLIKHLRKVFPDSVIQLINHREQKKEITAIQPYLKNKLGVGFVDISGSAEGFMIYDDCDLHVGFRVHAHIYNLSRRNLTILFNEDIRGMGVNTTIGLENLNVEMPSFGKKKLFGRYYLIRFHNKDSFDGSAGWMFDDYLKKTVEHNFQNYNMAFGKMSECFINMKRYFELIKTII